MPESTSLLPDTVTQSNFLAHTPAEFSVDAVRENMDGDEIGPNDLPRITIPRESDQWHVPWASDAIDIIEAVVIAQPRTRAYWRGKYVANDPKPPSCFSIDGLNGYGDPDGSGTLKRSVCKECPHSKFGQGEDRAPACREGRTLYLLTGQEDEILPTKLSVPPTSLTPWKVARMQLGSAPYWQRLWKFGLKHSPKYACMVLVPTPSTVLSEEELSYVRRYRDSFLPLLEQVNSETVAADIQQEAP